MPWPSSLQEVCLDLTHGWLLLQVDCIGELLLLLLTRWVRWLRLLLLLEGYIPLKRLLLLLLLLLLKYSGAGLLSLLGLPVELNPSSLEQ